MPQTKEDKDELIRAMHEDLDRVVTKEFCDAVYAQARSGESDAECEQRKKAVMAVLMTSVRTQRLYFVIRSGMMSLIAALITFIVVLYLGSIGVTQAVFLGIFIFVVSLIITRLFDKQVIKAIKKIIRYLTRHQKLEKFILKNL